MATGKSKVGREFANLLGWPFDDTDKLIEEEAGKTISQIFESEGEAAFRRIEQRIVERICQRHHRIVSLGGGAVMDDHNWQRIKSSGITICLKADPNVLFARISKKSNRPLVKNYDNEDLRKRIAALLAEREERYNSADFVFESREDLTPKQLACRIFETLLDKV